MPSYVLDTSLLLGGRDPPRDGTWATTPEADAEISPGGRDARRFETWKDLGLDIRSASPGAMAKVEAAGRKAGNLGRLSAADRSLVALAVDLKAILLTDDFTLLDVAGRLGVETRTVNTAGIAKSLDFKPRCAGCGRWFEEMPKHLDCPVCGSEVKLRPVNPMPRGDGSPPK